MKEKIYLKTFGWPMGQYYRTALRALKALFEQRRSSSVLCGTDGCSATGSLSVSGRQGVRMYSLRS